MKTVYRKIISFLTVICCLAGSLGTAYAAENGDTPRVVFVNEWKDSPDLYVSKTVTGEGAPAGDSFTFLLTLNGSAAGERLYRLCDGSQKELTKDQLKELGYGDMEQNVFYTSKSGTFSLRAGLQARFPDVGVGTAWEVTEFPRDHYLQTVPACADPEKPTPLSGQMKPEGDEAAFTNRYLSQTGDACRFEVSKSVVFPTGYEAPRTPEFTFVLSFGGTSYGGKTYTVQESGQTVDTGTTGADGSFTLRGGQTAVFEDEDLERGMEYRVEERPTDGWRTVGRSVVTGSIKAAETVVPFANAEASFAVSKELWDHTTPEEVFTFRLSLGGGVGYYLYDGKTPADPADAPEGQTADSDGKYYTGSDGTFRLKPGQTAVFTGVAPGTVYNVSEVKNPEYTQITPSAAEGYTGKEVAASTAETLPFINRKEEEAVRSLTVTKLIEDLKGDAHDPGDEFHFILSRQKEDGTFEPLNGRTYQIRVGNTSAPDTTGPGAKHPDRQNGELVLRGNETAHFDELTPGVYRVEEIVPNLAATGYQLGSATVHVRDDSGASEAAVADEGEPADQALPEGEGTPTGQALLTGEGEPTNETSPTGDGMLTDQTLLAGEGESTDEALLTSEGTPTSQAQAAEGGASSGSRTGADASGQAVQTGTLAVSGSLDFVFTNTWQADRLDLLLTKQNPSGDTNLADARFRLWKAEGTPAEGTPFGEIAKTEIETKSTSSLGFLVFEGLSSGTYYLEETIAPVGYGLLTEPVKITIARDPDDYHAVVTIAGPADAVTSGNVTVQTAAYTRDRIEITVKDQYLYELPKTGGAGTAPYRVIGFALLLAASGIVFTARRRRPAQD